MAAAYSVYTYRIREFTSIFDKSFDGRCQHCICIKSHDCLFKRNQYICDSHFLQLNFNSKRNNNVGNMSKDGISHEIFKLRELFQR